MNQPPGGRDSSSRRRLAVLTLALLGLSLLAGACAGAPSTLDTVGPRAARIESLWWWSFWPSMAIYALVIGLLLAALFRRGRRPEDDDLRKRGEISAGPLGSLPLVIAGGVVLPIVVLVPLSIGTLLTLAAEAAPPESPDLTIQVVGYQFWWEVRYPAQGFVTANEIHVPVGRPVRVTLETADVIHSFWVPQVLGKMDLVPGHVNSTWLQVDRPGVYWGECAEYCGLQHAHMAFMLVAEEPERFAAWAALQQQPALQPTDPFLLRGAQAFASQGCIACHRIRYGPNAVGGNAGPDLTHVGSRLTLAAGMLENSYGNMAGWIGNPQAIKPGNAMPIIPMDSETLRALAAYLESLE